jgi:hypothetical protein
VITPADSAPSAPEQMAPSTWDIQAPYVPGAIDTAFDGAGPMGDDVAGNVAAAQSAAEARYGAHMQQTHGQGSTIGVNLTLPDVVSDHSLNTGGDGAGHPFEEDS